MKKQERMREQGVGEWKEKKGREGRRGEEKVKDW
jgi:hypothetical protein